mmetsp:Transcript_3760/g.13754  ORF Transcript_3760/g.13754 Transcript_3760/m.13754 type:complete len:283 (-) Transcript_3760:296-1144(-)
MWSGPSCSSLISKALLCKASAWSNFCCENKRSARFPSAAATVACVGPSCDSYISKARLYNGSAASNFLCLFSKEANLVNASACSGDSSPNFARAKSRRHSRTICSKFVEFKVSRNRSKAASKSPSLAATACNTPADKAAGEAKASRTVDLSFSETSSEKNDWKKSSKSAASALKDKTCARWTCTSATMLPPRGKARRTMNVASRDAVWTFQKCVSLKTTTTPRSGASPAAPSAPPRCRSTASKVEMSLQTMLPRTTSTTRDAQPSLFANALALLLTAAAVYA